MTHNGVVNADYLEYLSGMPDSSIDMVITDPPYGMNFQSNRTKHKHAVLLGDGGGFSYGPLAKECYRVLREGSAIFCFTRWSTYPQHFKELSDAGFSMKEPLICQKRLSGMGDIHGSFRSNSEWIMFGTGRLHQIVVNLHQARQPGETQATLLQIMNFASARQSRLTANSRHCVNCNRPSPVSLLPSMLT